MDFERIERSRNTLTLHRTLRLVGIASLFVLAYTTTSWATGQGGGEFPGQRRGAGTHFRISHLYQ
jgi:hypothetical protein